MVKLGHALHMRDYFLWSVEQLGLCLSSPLRRICTLIEQEIIKRAMKSQTGLVLRL